MQASRGPCTRATQRGGLHRLQHRRPPRLPPLTHGPPSAPCPCPCLPAVRFASARLQRSGRCHESEILRALGRELPRYRSLDSNTMRQLVRNWAPDADRSSQGFYKGVSLVPGGGAAMQPAAAASPSAEASTDADAAARL